MVSSTRGHVELQAVHQGERVRTVGSISLGEEKFPDSLPAFTSFTLTGYRCLEYRLYLGGDVERSTVVPREGLVSFEERTCPRCPSLPPPPLPAHDDFFLLIPCSHHQLSLILDVLGTPSMEDFYNITSRRSRDYIRALPFRRKQNFDILYKDSNPLAIDFLKKTLTCEPSQSSQLLLSVSLKAHPPPSLFYSHHPAVDPKNRFTVEQCLSHPYLEAYHDPDDEPVAAPLVPGFFDFDLKKDDITREELKQLLYDEIMSFRMAPLSSQYEVVAQQPVVQHQQ